MSRNLARTADSQPTSVQRAPIVSDVKDGRCPKCGCRGLARTLGESDLSCIMCGAVIYETAPMVMVSARVA